MQKLVYRIYFPEVNLLMSLNIMMNGTIKQALIEDLEPDGDISTDFSVDQATQAKAEIIAKESGILAGSKVINLVLSQFLELKGIKADFRLKMYKEEGDVFIAGERVIEIEAPAFLLLSCERTILNFLQRLSGIATYTRALTEQIKAYPTQLLDTRKTTPGLREFEKQAFQAGGGSNHRFNLSSMVMLKENHLKLGSASSIPELVKNVQQKLKDKNIDKKIEVEINKDNLKYLEESCELGVDQVMLDNFEPNEIAELKEKVPSSIKLELSGGINIHNIESYAKSGVDFISTSSAMSQSRWIDFSMLINPCSKA